MAKQMLTCSDCGWRFDARDKRAYIPRPEASTHPCCPACALLTLRSREAWAVSNDCNGVFTHLITHTRKEARERLAAETAEGGDFGGKVVPIRVIVEPEDRHDIRNWSESQDRPEEKT